MHGCRGSIINKVSCVLVFIHSISCVMLFGWYSMITISFYRHPLSDSGQSLTNSDSDNMAVHSTHMFIHIVWI